MAKAKQGEKTSAMLLLRTTKETMKNLRSVSGKTTAVIIAAVSIAISANAKTPEFKQGEETRFETTAKNIYVYDGDTIIIDEQRLRLLEIDTPEISKPRCRREEKIGLQARDALRTLIAQAKTIEIINSGQIDRYDRPLIQIKLDGEYAGQSLITQGLAVTYRPGSAAWKQRKKHWCG